MDKYREQLRVNSYSSKPPERREPKPLWTHRFPEPSFSTSRPGGSSMMNSGVSKYHQPQSGFNPESRLSYRTSGISSMMNSGASKYHQHQPHFNSQRDRSYRMPGGSSMMNSGVSKYHQRQPHFNSQRDRSYRMPGGSSMMKSGVSKSHPPLLRSKSESELSHRISGIASMMNSGASKYHQPQSGFNYERERSYRISSEPVDKKKQTKPKPLEKCQSMFIPPALSSSRNKVFSSMMNSGVSQYHQPQSGFSSERDRSYRMDDIFSLMTAPVSKYPSSHLHHDMQRERG